jgi:hypothetical protein
MVRFLIELPRKFFASTLHSTPNGKSRWRRSFGLVAVFCLAASAAAHAQTNWIVNTLGDDATVSATAAQSNCQSGNSNTCALRDAILAADLDSGDVITFSNSIVGNGPSTISLTSTLPSLVAPMAILGPGAGKLTISGGFNNEVMVVGGEPVLLANLTIADGSSLYGGAILNVGQLMVLGVKFSGNIAQGANSSQGGAVYNTNVFFALASEFDGNTAFGSARGEGGAVFNASGATAGFIATTFSGNSANGQQRDAGGGALCNSGGTMALFNSTLTGNSANGSTQTRGGAIVNHNNGTLGLFNTTVTANWASEFGGGVYVENGEAFVENSLISGNWLGTSPMPVYYDDVDDQSGNASLSTDSSQPVNGSGDVLGYYNAATVNTLSSAPPPAVNLLPLSNYGGLASTMLPLPGSPAICTGLAANTLSPTQAASLIPSGLSTTEQEALDALLDFVIGDERGWPVSSSCPAGYIDAGAVQTNYLTINTLADTVNTTDTTSCTDGTESAGNTCSLRDLLLQTQTSTSTTTDASFAPSLFVSGSPSVPTPGTITLGAGGTDTSLPTIIAQLNLVGPGANLLTVSGNHDSNVGSIFQVPNSSAEAAFYGMTLANGKTVGSSSGPGNGGGAIANAGILSVVDDVVTGNQAVGILGGGVLSVGQSTLLNSTFTNNSSTVRGGAFFNGGYGQATIINSTFSGNSATVGGGAIENFATMRIDQSTIAGNNANSVGGGIDQSPIHGSTPNLINSIVAGNVTNGVATSGDCNNCTSYSGFNLVGLPHGITSYTQILGSPANTPVNWPIPTMVPLPGASSLLCAGTTAIMLQGITTDERGFPADPNCKAGAMDLGAAQTNYSLFGTIGYNGAVDVAISPSPVAAVAETNALTGVADTVGGIPITLALDGPGTLTGTTTVTTAATTLNNVATNAALYPGLAISQPGSGDSFGLMIGSFTPASISAAPFNISTATPTVSLQSNVNPTLTTATVTFTATVAPPASPAGLPTPTGTVTFYSGGTAICTAVPLSSGTAACMTSFSTTGPEQITASYSSTSATYTNATTASALTESVVTVNLNLPTATLNVLPGFNSTFSVSVAPVGSSTFPQPITLTLSGLPSGFTATFTPSNVIAAGSPATAISLVIQAPLSGQLHPLAAPGAPGDGMGTWSLALLLLPFAGFRRAGRRLRGGVLMIVLAVAGLAGALGLMGCSSVNLTPNYQTFNATLTATSGTYSTSSTFSVTVE